MAIGRCGHLGPATALNRPEFPEMVARFAAFDYYTEDDLFTFAGQGQIAGLAWQRAVLTWLHDTYSEQATSHVCAACRTLVSWHLGPIKSAHILCQQLTGLNYGLAYAEVRTCADQQLQNAKRGWLETSEWEQLEAWSRTRATTYQGDSYLNGMGIAPLSAAELQQLATLTQAIYARLIK